MEEVRARAELPTPRVARAIRLAAGVSQERLAAELHVHRVTVARWESGDRRPAGRHLMEYAQLLRQLRELS